jgi:F-type H+-transporting ATPase subunit epsilon
VSDNAIDLEIVTPDRKVLSVRAKEVVVPGIDGYFGVLPGHAPFLTRLGIGALSYKDDQGTHVLAAADGIVEVLGDRVTVLALLCEAATEIDIERAREAKRRAEAAMKEVAKLSDQDMLMIEASLKRALTRLQVASNLRS